VIQNSRCGANDELPGSSPPGVDLADQALAGNRRALARLLTLVENGDAEGAAALGELYPHTGGAHIIGFTGSTGAGKSTLVNRVAQAFRRRGMTLAVVAVDPTSPFSGGAMLGDRLRMRDLVVDPGVFIRSMASRGHPGGVAHATRDVVSVLDAVGTPVILVETVGAGQAQVDVSRIAHTVVLVEAPGMGDDVQALKAGLMEIADIIVVNKGDRPEAQQTLLAIRAAVAGSGRVNEVWEIPVLRVSATEGTGIEALVDSMDAHRRHLQETGLWSVRRTRQARAEVDDWMRRYLAEWIEKRIDDGAYTAAVEAVMRRECDPAAAARHLLTGLTEQLCSKLSG
jgi:LAO/AO transport system kinase